MNRSKNESNINQVFNFKGYNLPLTMDFTTWGKTYFSEDGLNVIVLDSKSNKKYYIKLYKDYQVVELKFKDKILLTFKDIMNNKGDLNTFTRIIKDNQEYIFINGKGGAIVKKIIKKVSFLKPIHKTIYLSNNFITMDLETRIINNGELEPYCVGIYDGVNLASFYLSDYKNSDEMLETSIIYLMKRKYDQYKIYLHNFSYFDGIFLLKILSNLSNNIRPIIRDGRLIDIRMSYLDKYHIYFRDSLLILPSSLKKLAINFNVAQKGIYPYKFVNDNTLDYIGNVPEYNYFDNISLEEYNEYYKSFDNNQWSLKDETIKYCIQDCITLYQIIDKFSKEIFLKFSLDVHKYPTISSLAFGIYRSNFYRDEYKVPLING